MKKYVILMLLLSVILARADNNFRFVVVGDRTGSHVDISGSMNLLGSVPLVRTGGHLMDVVDTSLGGKKKKKKK